jgi:hypothetical protein
MNTQFSKLYQFSNDNNVSVINDIIFLVHKEYDSVFGMLWHTECGKLIFQKNKPIEVNKGKTLPRVCSDISYTFKFISEKDLESFEIINSTHICYLEMKYEKLLV